MEGDLNYVPISMPLKHDVVLLCPGEPWTMNACLNFKNDMTLGYIEGYRKAAEKLIGYIEEINRDQDYLVYPILFLYRHHLELRLKELLDLLFSLGVRDKPAKNVHKLSRLWRECELALKTLPEAKGEDEWFTSVTRIIIQIEDIDPASDAFRYSKRADGTKSMPALTHINLAILRSTMNGILDWLNGASDALREHRKNCN